MMPRQQYSVFPSAPGKLEQFLVARTAAEEMDHYRKIARVAGDIAVEVSFVLSSPRGEPAD